MDAIITRLMDQYRPRQHPTSQQVLDQLPRIAVSKAEAPGLLSASTQDASDASIDDSTSALVTSRAVVSVGEPCTVCHDTFQAEEQVLQLPCNHCFHEDCIMPWLKEVGRFACRLRA